jgi:uncharacterized protein (DUF1684 family)
MKVYFRCSVVLLVLAISVLSCQSVSNSAGGFKEDWNVDSLRRGKDNEFASSKNSPFADLSQDFEGLKYFPVHEKWRVAVSWIQSDTTYVKKIVDSKGGVRNYRYEGEFGFELEGKQLKLPVWTDEKYPETLFLMFRDKTNGIETYGGGRYIEMQRPLKGETVYLDFNMAFNPYCHYNHNYSCPVIPASGHTLDLNIRAGEKLYFQAHE